MSFRHVLDILQDPWVVTSIRLLLHVFAAHVCVGLKDPQALRGHGRVVVDGDPVQVRVSLPVVLKNEQQLLRPTQSEDGKETLSTLPDDLMHGIREAMFPLLSRLVVLDPVGGLHDEDMDAQPWYLGLGQMSVLLAAVVARVQDTNPTDVDQEHRGAENVPSTVARKFDATKLFLLVEIDEFYLLHCLIDVGGPEDLVLSGNLAHSRIVVPQHAADGSGRVCHVDLLATDPIKQTRT